MGLLVIVTLLTGASKKVPFAGMRRCWAKPSFMRLRASLSLRGVVNLEPTKSTTTSDLDGLSAYAKYFGAYQMAEIKTVIIANDTAILNL